MRQLRALLKDAAAEGRPVCIGGARHSMGGQSLMRDGFAASLGGRIEPDTARRIVRVSGGARWREVIAALDPLGFSPAVTQSNNDFSVGGTLSVNAHGWAVPFGPFGATVKRFRLMLADGALMTCSREENAELFALAVGGYGLFGIVIDAELDMADNVLLDGAARADAGRAVRIALRCCGARGRRAHGLRAPLGCARQLSRRSAAGLVSPRRKAALTAAAAAHGRTRSIICRARCFARRPDRRPRRSADGISKR